jgi:hypothetical protein
VSEQNQIQLDPQDIIAEYRTQNAALVDRCAQLAAACAALQRVLAERDKALAAKAAPAPEPGGA